MQTVISPEKASALDRYMIETLEIPGLLLMEQAAAAVALEAEKLSRGKKILVICGKGNNGGDGWAAARILMTRGNEVVVGASSLELSGDAEINQRFFRHCGSVELLTEQTDFFDRHADAGVIIDALFGTGLSREPKGAYAEWIGKINAHPAAVVSVDIPSGIFGATGQGGVFVRADVTVTFQYPKIGHFLFPGREAAGRLTVAKIGVDHGVKPDALLAEALRLPERAANTNKGSFGRLTLVAGSKGMAGAAVLAASASVATGSGLTNVLCTEYTAAVLQSAVPEATVSVAGKDSFRIPSEFAPNATALAIGPGLGKTPDICALLKTLLPCPLPKVLDADALNVMAEHPELIELAKNAVLTPHPKEFSRLTGLTVPEILADPICAAKQFAKSHGVVLLLKGATTVVTDGASTVLVTAGCPGMAKGGSGDVLTGVIGSLLAQGLSPMEAAYHGAYFCGKAGERAYQQLGISMSPRDTVRNLCFR